MAAPYRFSRTRFKVLVLFAENLSRSVPKCLFWTISHNVLWYGVVRDYEAVSYQPVKPLKITLYLQITCTAGVVYDGLLVPIIYLYFDI